MSASQAPPQVAISAAVVMARLSACHKSQRGASLYYVRNGDVLITGRGYNRLPMSLDCVGDARCQKLCGRACLHAESVAIKGALINFPTVHRASYVVHIKVVDGEPVTSGPPSCWQCAREVAEYTAGCWLLHDGGWRLYTSEEFYRLSLPKIGE